MEATLKYVNDVLSHEHTIEFWKRATEQARIRINFLGPYFKKGHVELGMKPKPTHSSPSPANSLTLQHVSSPYFIQEREV